MSLHLETLAPDELHGFAEKCVSSVEPRAFATTRRGIMRFVRGAQFSVNDPFMDMVVKETSYSAVAICRQGRWAGRLLGAPEPSSQIRIYDLERPDCSRQFEVFPGRPDPVLVHMGNLAAGSMAEVEIRHPIHQDLRLLNSIIDQIKTQDS